MRFKAVEVKNIRSYKHERVEFPEGSVVLAGEVGAGKSSLLLAIEFALFGIRRGQLPGEALLRRGTRHGKVTLKMEVGGKDVTLVRELTRESDSVRQNEGYIEINGSRRFKTPRELKAEVLKLLGYPMDLLTKQKSRIYRYTVYTPQERMNEIITEMNEEERLDTLRKVFRMDKYKRISENAENFLTALRRKRRILRPTFTDLEEKRKERDLLLEKLDELRKKLDRLQAKKAKQEERLESLKEEKKAIKEEIEHYNALQRKIEALKAKIQTKTERLQDLTDNLQKVQEKIQAIEDLSRPTDKSVKEVKQEIKELRDKKDAWLENPQQINDEIKALAERKEEMKQEINEKEGKIQALTAKIETHKEHLETLQGETGTCPLCGRKLTEEHRTKKIREFKDNIKRLKRNIHDFQTIIKDLGGEIKTIEKETKKKAREALDRIKQRIDEKDQLRTDLQEYLQKQQRKKEFQEELQKKKMEKAKLKGKVKQLEEKKKEVSDELKALQEVKEKENEIEEKLERQRTKIKELDKQITATKTDKEHTEEDIEHVSEEIEAMEKRKEFWRRLGQYKSWIENHFLHLVESIETQFLARVHKQFTPLFRKWFNFLIDDEGLNAKIDRKFSPILHQEGYQAPYTTLSGGEKASVALAYRLALNKVINTQIENIRTKDVIILDEPTDGFSDQQLDKVRDIIYRIDIPQIIIVSHERKVQDYVEQTIKIKKEEGISRTAS